MKIGCDFACSNTTPKQEVKRSLIDGAEGGRESLVHAANLNVPLLPAHYDLSLRPRPVTDQCSLFSFSSSLKEVPVETADIFIGQPRVIGATLKWTIKAETTAIENRFNGLYTLPTFIKPKP